ncbi:polysaccharide biosynthesis C-terminal domain-containing protein, partial [Candidatus Omnitrophota bacterium]
RVDVLMLSKISGDAAVGWYGAAHKIIDAYSLFPILLVISLFPVLIKVHKENKDSLESVSNKVLKYLLIIGIPLIIFSLVDAKKIILFLYNEEFTNSIPVFQLLSIRGMTFFSSNVLLGYLLFTTDKEKLYLKLVVITLCLNIFLNFILIPKYSYIGASLATAISGIFSSFLHYRYVSRFVCKIKVLSYSIKPLISSIFIIGIILLLKANLFWDIIIVIIMYPLLLKILKTFTIEDKQILRSIIR